MSTEFEPILELVGGFGKFQKKILFLILIPISFFISVTINLIYFQLIVPDYWCQVPGRDDSELSVQQWKDLTIPKNHDGHFAKCLQYQRSIVDEDSYSANISKETNSSYFTTKTQGCLDGWDHDRTLFWETVATEEEWLCEKEIFSTHILAINMAGNAVGTLLLPIIADRITGRKYMFFITLAIQLVFSLAILLVRQFYLRAIFRFLAGLAFQANFQMPYVISLEFLSPEHRSLTSFLSFAAWTMGMCFTALIAYLFPHWKYLLLASCVPCIAFFGLWRVFPESPRWLLSKGKLEECSLLLMKVANTNRQKEVTSEILQEKLKRLWEIENSSRIHLKQIFSFPRLCKNGVLLLIIAFLTWTTYGCVLLNMGVLPNHYFLNFFILSLIELPSNVLGLLSVNYLGRRMSSVLSYTLAALFSLLAVLSTENRILLLVMVALIKLFTTEGLYVVYVMTGEIFPTPIRSSGFGIIILAGTLGMLVSPYIIEAGEVFEYTIMIAMHLVCFLLSLFLPETIGLPLPQTLHDAEILGQDRPFFKWIHHWNVIKWMPCPSC